MAHVKLLKMFLVVKELQPLSWRRHTLFVLLMVPVVSCVVKTICLNVGAAPASPFWVTTGQAGGANQQILNASPAPRFNSQVPLSIMDHSMLVQA
jgi:hypothetical protein